MFFRPQHHGDTDGKDQLGRDVLPGAVETQTSRHVNESAWPAGSHAFESGGVIRMVVHRFSLSTSFFSFFLPLSIILAFQEW